MKVALQNLAILAFLVICMTYVGPQIDEAQAMEDAFYEAQRQEQQALLKQQALQALCGGPEATVVERAHGGYYCLDTNGRKTKTIPGLARPVSQGHEIVARVFGARLQQTNFECANSFCETESAGVVSAGSI